MENQIIYILFLISLLAMFFGYNLQLDRRTLKLEKKNGREQHQIDELKKKVAELEAENEKLRKEIELFKSLFQKYTRKHKSIEN